VNREIGNTFAFPAIIEVICCVFPDGTVFWTDDVEDQGRKVIAAWKSLLSPEQAAEMDAAKVTMGMVYIRMPASAYIGLGSSNQNPIAMKLYADSKEAST
jgi:hypothetical protein